jgi:hypothetical protein
MPGLPKRLRNLWNAMEPYSSGGVYVNYLRQEVASSPA